MASIERTAVSAVQAVHVRRELHVFYTPQPDEIVWTREVGGSDEHLLALVTQLKAVNRLGYFPVLDEVPAEVVAHIRRDLRLPETTMPVYASTRTAAVAGTATWLWVIWANRRRGGPVRKSASLATSSRSRAPQRAMTSCLNAARFAGSCNRSSFVEPDTSAHGVCSMRMMPGRR